MSFFSINKIIKEYKIEQNNIIAKINDFQKNNKIDKEYFIDMIFKNNVQPYSFNIKNKNCFVFDESSKQFPREFSQNCIGYENFWKENKKDLLIFFGYGRDIVGQISYFHWRNGNLAKALKILKEPLENTIIETYEKDFLFETGLSFAFNHSIKMSHLVVFDKNIKEYYAEISKYNLAGNRMYVFNRAGIKVKPPVDWSRAELEGTVFGKKRKEWAFENKIPIGNLKGKIFVNNKPFNGKIEFRTVTIGDFNYEEPTKENF